jgi:hypothetical protein
MSIEETQKVTKATSPRKIEANRRNAQHSTGPRTSEGRAKSSQNATTHGIFVKQFLKGATDETVVEVEALAAAMREHYQPVGIVEEILVQKIIAETVRYGRALTLEHPKSVPSEGYLVHFLDRVVRYTTSTSRALYRAMEELERLQAARKPGAISSGDSTDPRAKPTEEISDTHVQSTSLSDGHPRTDAGDIAA